MKGQDVIRQKPKLNLTGFSDKLTNILVCQNIETKKENLETTDSTLKELCYQPTPNKFESMQMF